MKIELEDEEIAYFEKQGQIEFYGLIESEEERLLIRAIENELQRRMREEEDQNYASTEKLLYKNAISYSIDEMPSKTLFQHGRDLVLSSPALRSILHSRKFVSTASQLIRKKSLRWGFDQLMSEELFFSHIQQKDSLQSSLSQSNLAIGCALIFSKKKEESIDESNRAVRILFFLPEFLSEGDSIAQEMSRNKSSFFSDDRDEKCSSAPQSQVLLFGYTFANSLYLYNSADPHTHRLKRLGYGFGDHFTDKTHPILYR